jgi:PASTA domain
MLTGIEHVLLPVVLTLALNLAAHFSVSFFKKRWQKIAIFCVANLVVVGIVAYEIRILEHEKNLMIVPDLLHRSHDEAARLCEKQHLKEVRIDDTKPSEWFPGTVIAQSLAPGSQVYEGSEIKLTISVGKESRIKSQRSGDIPCP